MSINVTVVGTPRVAANHRFSPSAATAATPPYAGTNSEPRPSTVAVMRGPSVGIREHHRLRPSSAVRAKRLQPRSETVAWNDVPIPSEEATPIAGAPSVRDQSSSGESDTPACARDEFGGPPATDDQLAAWPRRAPPLGVSDAQPEATPRASPATTRDRTVRGNDAGATGPPVERVIRA